MRIVDKKKTFRYTPIPYLYNNITGDYFKFLEYCRHNGRSTCMLGATTRVAFRVIKVVIEHNIVRDFITAIWFTRRVLLLQKS